jgi:predicted RND superfamily exporter protein
VYFELIVDIIVGNIPFCIANPTFTKLFKELEEKVKKDTSKVNEVTPAASRKKRKESHHSDESYMLIEDIDPSDLTQLARMTWEVNNATSNYEYVMDVHNSMMEDLDNAFVVMVQYQKKKDAYKQSLDLKYRKE